MDLLFKKYASPMDLMKLYIDNGRFGEFVSEFIRLEVKRKQEETKKEENDKLWTAYIHSYSEQSFADWKNDLKIQKPSGNSRAGHTREEILKNKKIQKLMNRLNG